MFCTFSHTVLSSSYLHGTAVRPQLTLWRSKQRTWSCRYISTGSIRGNFTPSFWLALLFDAAPRLTSRLVAMPLDKKVFQCRKFNIFLWSQEDSNYCAVWSLFSWEDSVNIEMLDTKPEETSAGNVTTISHTISKMKNEWRMYLYLCSVHIQ